MKLEKIAGVIVALGLLGTASPAKANMSQWLGNFHRSVYGDLGTAMDCYRGTVSERECANLDRRIERSTRINSGAAASRGIRNGVRRSNDNMRYRQYLHNLENEGNYWYQRGNSYSGY